MREEDSLLTARCSAAAVRVKQQMHLCHHLMPRQQIHDECPDYAEVLQDIRSTCNSDM